MTTIYPDITALIGKTPLVKLERLAKRYAPRATFLAKVESFNPSGSIKDRIALAMVIDAEQRGALQAGGTIIEPTSGNTGIGLAMVGAARGYKVILTMPDTMSPERRTILKAYGAEVVLTPGSQGMNGAIAKATELLKEHENSFMPSQFTNQANVKAHYQTTGRELFADTEGKFDLLIAGVGTGGTISGTAAYLREHMPYLHVVAVEPASSAVLSTGQAGPHKIQGLGAGFIPETLNTAMYDEVVTVENEQAFKFAKILVQTEGILGGISAGAAVAAAVTLAQSDQFSDKTFVIILPDDGDRYLSSLYAE